jgi:hypothetical protein
MRSYDENQRLLARLALLCLTLGEDHLGRVLLRVVDSRFGGGLP